MEYAIMKEITSEEIDHYADFLYQRIDRNKKNIALSSFKKFDKSFDENKAEEMCLYKWLMKRIISHYKLDTLTKELIFLSSHFQLDFILKLRQYYVTDIDASENIHSLDDIKKIDSVTGFKLYKYFTDKDIYSDILRHYYKIWKENGNTYDYSSKDIFVLQLLILDKLFPDKNHIPHFLVYAMEKILNDPFSEQIDPAKQLKLFAIYFAHKKLKKDNLLKIYFEKKGLVYCLRDMNEYGLL